MTDKKTNAITHFFGGGKNRTVVGTNKGMRGSEKTSSGFPPSKASKVKTTGKWKHRKPLTSVTATAARLEKWRREHG